MTTLYEKYLKTGERTPRERPKGTRMGRGQFKLIAAALRQSKDYQAGKPAHAQWLATVYDVADALATTNPSFRRETFLAACGVETDG